MLGEHERTISCFCPHFAENRMVIFLIRTLQSCFCILQLNNCHVHVELMRIEDILHSGFAMQDSCACIASEVTHLYYHRIRSSNGRQRSNGIIILPIIIIMPHSKPIKRVYKNFIGYRHISSQKSIAKLNS